MSPVFIKLFAVVFLLVAGQPGDDLGRFSYRDTFPDVAACEAFAASAEGKTAVEEFRAFVASQVEVPFDVRTECKEDD